MKPTTFWVTLSTFVLVACTKEKQPIPPEVPVQKQVTYHIFAGSDYSHPIHQNSKAELRLQVRVINYKTGAMRLVWDSTFNMRKLTEYPSYANKSEIKKSYPVLDSHEKLNGSYSVRYDLGGYIKQEGRSDEAGPGKTSILIEAAL